MSKIRWISQMMQPEEVQEFLNRYDFIAESLQVATCATQYAKYAQVTFMLKRTYDSERELERSRID